MVDESRDEGMLEEGEYERLSGALGFTSRTVVDVLLPLDELETVRRGARVADVEVVCAEHRLLALPGGRRRRRAGRLPAHQGRPPGRPARPRPDGRGQVDPAVRRRAADRHAGQTRSQTLQAKGAHMARVVDEEGRLLGVVTLEDVIEELVGEIRDAAHADGH